jgi:hypothetical protein
MMYHCPCQLSFYIIPFFFLSFSPPLTDRQKVLRHHPDKRKAAGEEVRADDDYFTCITKAYETLSVASKRRAYDSVDSEFDDDVPSSNAANKSRFFEVTYIHKKKTCFFLYLFISIIFLADVDSFNVWGTLTNGHPSF